MHLGENTKGFPVPLPRVPASQLLILPHSFCAQTSLGAHCSFKHPKPANYTYCSASCFFHLKMYLRSGFVHIGLLHSFNGSIVLHCIDAPALFNHSVDIWVCFLLHSTLFCCNQQPCRGIISHKHKLICRTNQRIWGCWAKGYIHFF